MLVVMRALSGFRRSAFVVVTVRLKWPCRLFKLLLDRSCFRMAGTATEEARNVIANSFNNCFRWCSVAAPVPVMMPATPVERS
jgi:hypothetical protein